MRTLVWLIVALIGGFPFVLSNEVSAQVDEDYTLSITGECPPVGEDLEIAIELDFSGGDGIQGWQWGICHDGDQLTFVEAVQSSGVDTLSFTFEAISPILGTNTGWTVGALLNVITGEQLDPADDVEMYTATYTVGIDAEEPFPLEWCDDLGSPPVEVAVVVSGTSVTPVQNDFEACAALGPEYINGDADDDGVVSVTDPFYILNALFLDGPEITCEDAADVDDDGEIGMDDMLLVLEYLYLVGVPPAAPFPDCGGVGLNCDVYESCL